jgi:hypothetical protein
MRVSALEATIATLEATVRDLEPATLSGDAARQLVELAARGERLFGALKSLAARRVSESNAWRAQGERTAAHWLARNTGTSVGQAIATLETAARLHELPALDAAYRAGALSLTQANEIASAAAADPTAERELVDAAANDGVAELRERCRRVKASAVPDEATRREAIRRTRSLRHWTDPDGAFRIDGRLLPEDGAELLVGLEPFRARTFAEARAAGRRERYEAYLADALVAMARDARAGSGAASSVPRASVHVRVDHTAFRRGHVEAGETCEIPGIGPIPVATARALAADAVISAIVTDGVDVKAVAHLGRSIPAHVRTALVARDPVCVVPGCHTRDGLEIDHIVAFAEGGGTRLANLCRLCRWHHYLKTHQGHRLTGGPGDWAWKLPETHAHGPPDGVADDTGAVEPRQTCDRAAAHARVRHEHEREAAS